MKSEHLLWSYLCNLCRFSHRQKHCIHLSCWSR